MPHRAGMQAKTVKGVESFIIYRCVGRSVACWLAATAASTHLPAPPPRYAPTCQVHACLVPIQQNVQISVDLSLLLFCQAAVLGRCCWRLARHAGRWWRRGLWDCACWLAVACSCCSGGRKSMVFPPCCAALCCLRKTGKAAARDCRQQDGKRVG